MDGRSLYADLFCKRRVSRTESVQKWVQSSGNEWAKGREEGPVAMEGDRDIEGAWWAVTVLLATGANVEALFERIRQRGGRGGMACVETGALMRSRGGGHSLCLVVPFIRRADVVGEFSQGVTEGFVELVRSGEEEELWFGAHRYMEGVREVPHELGWYGAERQDSVINGERKREGTDVLVARGSRRGRATRRIVLGELRGYGARRRRPLGRRVESRTCPQWNGRGGTGTDGQRTQSFAGIRRESGRRVIAVEDVSREGDRGSGGDVADGTEQRMEEVEDRTGGDDGSTGQ